MSVTLYTPSSSKIIHEARVDFRQRVIQPVIHIVQYDKSLPIVAVKLYNNGIEYPLPVDANISIRWGKRDHTFVYDAALGCNSDRTTVYFEITEQMTIFYGEHNPIIELRNGTSLAGSGSIPFYLDRNPIQLGDVESNVELGVLENAVQQSQQAATEALADADRAALAAGQLVETIADVRDEMDSKLDKKPDGTNDLINVNGKLSSPYVPDYILNVQQIMGEFKTLLPTATIAGQYWIFTGTDGTVIGSYTWHLGDYAIWDGSVFIHLDNTTAVRSVNGKTGAVVLDGSDIKVKAGINDAKLDVVVQELSDEVLTPTYEEVLHEDLISEITATDNVEIIDDAGVLIKVEGNEPTNLIVNGDFSNGTTGFSGYYNATISVENGYLKVIKSAANNISTFQMNTPTGVIGDKYYYSMDIKTSGTDFFDYAGIYNIVNSYDTTQSMRSYPRYNISNGVFSDFTRISSLNTLTNMEAPTITRIYIYTSGAQNSIYYLDNIRLYNVSDMIRKGIKNDSGVSFALLSDAQIKEQMDIWVTNGFPTVINKLVSKSDNLFDSNFYPLTDLESENLVNNSDLLIPKASPNENQALGFNYSLCTDITLTNGIAKFTPTAQFGSINIPNNDTAIVGHTYYEYVYFRSESVNTYFVRYGYDRSMSIHHSGNGEFQFGSKIGIKTNTDNRFDLTTNLTSGFTPIYLDYTGLIDITDLVSRGILPSGLTDAQYKTILDSACNRSKTPMVNVPLRETSLISVEPSTAYKFIKASDNTPIHKVVEYTTDGQMVKVTTLSYTDHKATFTTQPQTTKIKLVSDLMNRVPNKTLNGNFSEVGYWTVGNSSFGSMTIANNKATITITNVPDATYKPDLRNTSVPAGQKFIAEIGRVYYTSMYLTSSKTGNFVWYMGKLINNLNVPVANTRTFVSSVITATIATEYNLLYYTPGMTLSIGDTWTVESIKTFDITDFKNAGVVNDTGTLFSRLTIDEIKEQMDIWVQNGFPDQVIHALYPNGADSAIAIKYNDADDIFRPQQIDELPLGITLRSGEYWQDGYVIKQNGNAEYYPLSTTFSAWNYGQLEAVYDSGIPADFTIKFAQNTKAQVQTNSDYLIEARERLDTLRRNQELLIEKLGDDVLSNDFDSFAGITSPTYEYYGLEGIKEGSELAIEGYGQSIQNLLSKATTIQTTQTVRGVTVDYDSETGIFTVNGTSTAGAAFNITLATGMDFGLPTGTAVQLMRYYDSGTVNLNGSYLGYTITGASTSNRINENSESLYDPYINGSGNLSANHATNKQQVLFQVWAPGIVFTDFKFKIGIYEGLQLRPFILPTGTPAKSNVTIYNRTLNNLNITNTTIPVTAGVTITYDAYTQEFLLSGTANATASVSLNATFVVKSGDRISIKRLYQSGDVTGVGGVLPRLKLDNSENTAIVYNDIYKMTAPEGSAPTPDISFNTGTVPADTTLTLKLGITSGQVFDNYRFRLMIHNKSSDIGYVEYRKEMIGTMHVGANEKTTIKFKVIPFGMLELIAANDSLNLLFGDSITDLRYSVLEYNAGIGSPNRKISALDERIASIDTVFKDKVIAVWGDSRESNNPTSDPGGVGDQKDTSWPALLAKKLKARVLNFGLSGGAWAQNIAQQDAAAAIVNRVQTEDPTASADIIIISSMNDFKLATPLGLPTSRTITDYYGALRLTFERLAAKYPGKKIVVVLPQKRFDENTKYGAGASYYAYRKAQIDVCKEYGISTVDLYNNFPNSKLGSAPTAYSTNMINDTHFSSTGNNLVAELVARHLIGNGNNGSVDLLPPIPSTDGTYKLQVVITGGIPTFSWVV